MRMGSAKAIADPGKRFVLTEDGYSHTPEYGEAVKGYEQSVPVSWVKKGYVEED